MEQIQAQQGMMRERMGMMQMMMEQMMEQMMQRHTAETGTAEDNNGAEPRNHDDHP